MSPASEITRSSRGSSSSKVNDAASNVITECDAHQSCCSEYSVGEVTQTSISDETSERQTSSSLAAALASKQLEVTQSFAGMVSKMASLLSEKELEIQKLMGQSDADLEANKLQRQEQTDICTKAVNSLSKKQIKIIKQLEKLVLQLEESNAEKDVEKVQLKKQLAQTKEKMKIMKSTMDQSLKGNNRRPNFPKPPGAQSSRPHTDNQNINQRYHDSFTERTEIFSIKEISFKTTVVDVTQVMTRHEDDDKISMSSDDGNAASNVRLIL